MDLLEFKSLLKMENTGNRSFKPSNKEHSILIVDDYEINSFVLKRCLEKQGYSVITAINGREALRKARQKKFSIIVMDIEMPGLDGFHTTTLIRRRATQKEQPIIIAYSGKDGIEERATQCGMNDVVYKTADKENIMKKIEHWIDFLTS
jgi:CheY-like chemotaxis protein